jgi:hypothetical protein
VNFSTTAAECAAKVHQLLVGMMPRRWQTVTITVERDDDGDFRRVTNLGGQVVAGAGAPPPFLGLDNAAQIAAMNEALDELSSDLEDMWSGTSARMDRLADGGASLVLLGSDGEEQSTLTLTPDLVASFTLSDEIFDALDRTRAQAAERQTAFQKQVAGYKQWNFDQSKAELSFVLADGRSWVMPGQIVGTWSRDDTSWLWGWANESVDAKCRVAVANVRDGARPHRGLAALTTGSFHARQPMAVELAMFAALQMNARGVFPGDYGSGIAFIAALG